MIYIYVYPVVEIKKCLFYTFRENLQFIHRTPYQTAYISRSSYQVLALCVIQDYAIKFVIFAFII